MPGVTLEDMVNQEVPTPIEPTGQMLEEVEQAADNSQAKEMLSKVLTAETGAGAIGDYLQHPMNFNNSMGMAQILRGLTGIVGNLKLAIIDVVVGVLRFSKEKKGVLTNDVSSRGGISS